MATLSDHEKLYQQTLAFANGCETFVTDGGNFFWKMIRWNNGIIATEIFDHAVVEIEKSEYNTRMYYLKGKFAPHLLRVNFKGEDRYFVVGEEAYSIDPSFEPQRGRAKYTPEYYGVMFLSGILRLTGGKVPENINALLAHPPGDVELRMELMKSVARKWKFECSGVLYEVKVEYVNVADEFVGGVMDMTLGADGNELKDDLNDKIFKDGRSRILIADMGGGSFDLAQMVKGSIDYTAPMLSERIGLQQAIDATKREIDQLHIKDLRDAESGFPREEVIKMFMDSKNHKYYLFGKEYDGTAIYQDAVNPIIRQAVQAARKYTGGLARFSYVLLTGGGSGLLWEEITKHVFPQHAERKAVYMVTSASKLHLANVNGMAKMLPGWQAKAARDAKKLLKKA